MIKLILSHTHIKQDLGTYGMNVSVDLSPSKSWSNEMFMDFSDFEQEWYG